MKAPPFLTSKPLPQDSSLTLIIILVITLHVLACTWVIYFDHTNPKPAVKTETKRLTVQTIALKPTQRPTSIPTTPSSPASTAQKTPVSEEILPPPTAQLPPNPPPPQATTPQKQTVSPSPVSTPPKSKPANTPPSAQTKINPSPPKSAPSPKKPLPKQPVAKQPTPKPAAPKPVDVKPPTTTPSQAPIAKNTAETAAQKKLAEEQAAQALAAKQRQQALISQAQERIAKIGRSNDKITPSEKAIALEMALPLPINNLNIDDVSDSGIVQFDAREASYRDELASRMKLLLRLPEYGDVKLKLTLERSGKVSKVVIVSAQNANNRSYIEKTVPTLSFPSFGSHFGTESQHTFSITLSNDL